MQKRFFVECAFPHLGKRGAASWKSAFCYLRLTEKRILYPVTHGKAHSAIPRSRKLRFSVTPRLQNASFRDVAAPGRCGATPRQPAGHYGKRPNWANALEQPPASLRGGLRQGPQISVRSLASRKSAFWPDRLTERRTLPNRWVQTALFRHVAAPGRCGATPRQPAGRLASSSRNGDDHVCDRPRPSYASTRPLKSCGLVQTTATRVQTLTQEVPFSIAR